MGSLPGEEKLAWQEAGTRAQLSPEVLACPVTLERRGGCPGPHENRGTAGRPATLASRGRRGGEGWRGRIPQGRGAESRVLKLSRGALRGATGGRRVGSHRDEPRQEWVQPAGANHGCATGGAGCRPRWCVGASRSRKPATLRRASRLRRSGKGVGCPKAEGRRRSSNRRTARKECRAEPARCGSPLLRRALTARGCPPRCRRLGRGHAVAGWPA